MSSLFSPDAKLYQAISWLATLVLLNLFLVVSMVLVIPGGIGLLLVFVQIIKLISGDERNSPSHLFALIKPAVLPATLAWLGNLVIAGVLIWEWVVFSQMEAGWTTSWLRASVLLGATIVAMTNAWFWPLLARRVLDLNTAPIGTAPITAKSTVNLVANAFKAAMKFLPRTILALLAFVVPLALLNWSLTVALQVLFWFLVIGLAFACYLNVLSIKRFVIRHEVGS